MAILYYLQEKTSSHTDCDPAALCLAAALVAVRGGAMRYRYVAGMQAMAARELLGLVAEGCSVLDPFCGSGTVLIDLRRKWEETP